MAAPAVRISELRKEYPGRGGRQPVVAVDGVDFEIAVGEIVAFLGPNGAGKTTTLDIAHHLERGSTDAVVVEVLDPTAASTADIAGTTLQRRRASVAYRPLVPGER
jgi:ABC-2 type transport system ATP-binding protein